MNALERLKTRFARIATIGEASAMLNWDAAAMMPPGGATARGDQLAVLAGLAHELLIAPDLNDDLMEAETDPPDGRWAAVNLALMRHASTRATALAIDLVEARARACSACEQVWRKAREQADFDMVRPYLETVVGLERHAAHALGEALGLKPYDALMDGHQRGIRAKEIAPVFADYEAFLQRALPEAEARQAHLPEPARPTGPFPIEAQEELCRRLAERIGLNFTHARLDRSAHPFTGGSPTDVRITSRYTENDFTQAVLAVIHETGHALYERGLPEAWARQPVGADAGMAAHESQSLIIEMQAARSDAFLRWLGPELHRTFGGNGIAYEPGNLARRWRRVERGFIRVDADEMTYPAHVILRFRLEQALIEGQLAIADLPDAWNEEFRRLLGLLPPEDARGCLQDIHWYDGAFGYFPCYTLGAMAAAQLMTAARCALPGLDDALEQGDFGPLVGWLRQNVHARGNLLDFNELLRAATGKPLDPKDFEAHLTRRYLS